MTYDHWKTTEPDDGYDDPCPIRNAAAPLMVEQLRAELDRTRAEHRQLLLAVDRALCDTRGGRVEISPGTWDALHSAWTAAGGVF